MGNDMEVTSVLLVAFGNPLWDVCVSLTDSTLLSKFGLADDSSKEVTAAEYESLLKAVESFAKDVCPGGAALNTLRVFQWLIAKPQSSVFFGSIGDDDTGRQLINRVHEAGVQGRFKIHYSLMTGSAICLINKNLRTLVAHLGAANVYSQEDLTEEDRNIITGVQLVYIENFFFCHSPEVVWNVIALCRAKGVAVALNLSGSYLFEEHAASIISLVKSVNIVIGNGSEYLSLAKSIGWKNFDIKSIAKMVCDLGVESAESFSSADVIDTKFNKIQDRGKIVVITRGHDSVICANQKTSLFETPVLKPKSDIKDTTGAGDAFAAGFLSGVIKNLSIRQSVQMGCYASTEIIQQIGCRPPDYLPSTMEEIQIRFSENNS